MSRIHQSTQEEIAAERERVKAAHCPGDRVHSTDFRDWHDWRLWERQETKTSYHGDSTEIEFATNETWYCTRCRKIEKRVVDRHRMRARRQ